MVWRHTADPDAAAALAFAVSAPGPQSILGTWGRALSVDAGVARSQFPSSWARDAAAAWLADPAHDVTAEDAFGTKTASDAAAFDLTTGNLAAAWRRIARYAGGFTQSCVPEPQPLGGEMARAALTAAASAGNADQVYAPGP